MENKGPQHEEGQLEPDFSPSERKALYRAIYQRRDVRGQFMDDPIPDAVLSKILLAAHHAPSVGFMQPWNFIVIKSKQVKQRVFEAFSVANEEAAQMFPDEKSRLYRSLKLEGIRDAPVNICITCDRDRGGPVVLGRTAMKEVDLYSTVCAVQNLWLAARTEGLGVGWVSIVHPDTLRQALNIPEKIRPVAYLCVGYVSLFLNQPELQRAGWRNRLPLEELVYFDEWQGEPSGAHAGLMEDIRQRWKAKDFY